MSDVDTAGLALANIWERQRTGEITEAEAAPLIADQLRNALPAQLLQLSKTENVMGRITNTLFTLGPPDPTFGAPNSVAFDLINGHFYGAKDATTGWPAPMPLFGEDGADGAPGADTAEALIVTYKLIYGVQYVYYTAADFSASPPPSPIAGERMVWLFDPNPLNNIWFEHNGTSWLDKTAKNDLLSITYQEPRLSGSPNAHLWKPHWNSGYNYDGLYGGLRLEVDADGLTNFNPGCQFFSAYVDGDLRFEVNNAAGMTYMAMGSDSTNFLGIGHASDGVMTLFSKINPTTNEIAEFARISWAGTPGEAVEVNFAGTNRVHLHSAAAFVHSANNGRFEWEGYGSPRINFIGYEIASSTGKTFNFVNTGQAGAEADYVASISTVRDDKGLLELCTLDIGSGLYTRKSHFDGKGRWAFGTAAPLAAVDAGIGGMCHTPRTLAQVNTAFPSPTSGLFAFINDASAAHAGNSGNAVTGGGTFDAPIYYGEGAWRYV